MIFIVRVISWLVVAKGTATAGRAALKSLVRPTSRDRAPLDAHTYVVDRGIVGADLQDRQQVGPD